MTVATLVWSKLYGHHSFVFFSATHHCTTTTSTAEAPWATTCSQHKTCSQQKHRSTTCAKREHTSRCEPPSSRHHERRTRCREHRHRERRQRTTIVAESPPLQQRNATTTFEQIGATANPCHQSHHCCIWNVDDITTAHRTTMPEGEEKEYCCREGHEEEKEKGGSRIWCPN